MIKKMLLSVLAVAVLLSSPWARQANAVEPLAVISFSGYQEVVDDIDFIGSLSGQEGMGAQVEFMLALFAPGVAGIDKDRPWGAAATTDGAGAHMISFVPVNDLDAVIAGFGQFVGEPADAGDGVLEIETDDATVYLKEQDGWAFIAQSKDALATLPEDPVRLLDGLNSKYDVAARVYLQNIPEALRTMAIDQLKMGVETQMEQGPDESDEQFQLRRALTNRQMETLITMMNDLDQFTVGWAIDREEKNTFADITMTAVPGSKTAQQFAAASQKQSQFGGFMLPDALFTVHANSTLVEQDIEQLTSVLKTLATQVNDELDKDEDLDEQSRAVVKDLFNRLMEVVEKTIASGNLNTGLAVVGEGPVAIVGGGFVADGDALEAIVKKAVELLSHEPEFPEVKFNVGEHKGVRFHTASGPIPDTGDEDAENARKLFGDDVTITLGFGKQSAYVAIGPDGMSTIKQVIDASEQVAGQELSSGQVSLAIGPLLRLAAKIDPEADAQVAQIGALLKEIGDDHITLTTEIITNGVNYRLEIEEGILKTLGAAAQAAGAGPQF